MAILGCRVDTDKIGYVLRYYSHFMTRQESEAYRHLTATAKAMHGRTDVTAQKEARGKSAGRFLSADPDVLKLACKGASHFAVRTAQRILDEHRTEVEFNCCPKCARVARTPKARQCRYCKFDWHSAES